MAKALANSAGAREASAWWLAAKNLLFPQFCRQCGLRLLTEENGFFCPTCWEASGRIERPFCIVCGGPYRGAVGFGTQSNYPCATCREAEGKRRGWDRTRGAARYGGPVEEAIKLLKFHDKPRLARPLGELMRAFAEAEMDGAAYDHIVPVPLHRVRARDRGFNQAELLAREVAPAFPGAEVALALRRIRPTRVQSRLTGETERRANVKGAFQPAPHARLTGARVLLVDDVITTGGTVGECARVLRKAGAERVDVFAAALAYTAH